MTKTPGLQNVSLPKKPEHMSVKLYAARCAACSFRFRELQRLVRIGHMTNEQAEATMKEFQGWQFQEE
jgi:hypothetical protein